jgi:polyhydroxybutyrate depolymerase
LSRDREHGLFAEVKRSAKSASFALSVALILSAVACGESKAPAVVVDAGPDVAAADGPPASDAGAHDGGDAGVSKRSAGCGLAPEPALGMYVRQDIVVPGVAEPYTATYTNRIYWIRIPHAYDPDRAYPTVFLGPGCGGSGQTPIPLHAASMDDAILIGLNGVNNCFNKDSADTPELPYFDATLAAVEDSLCVDKSRVFVAGFSSGSWLTSYLGCARAGVIRGQASVAGGLPAIPPTCAGPIAAMYVADTDDNKNDVATVKLAVERARVADGCGTETEPYDFGVASPCVQYKGCREGFPVVWCVTSGVGHADNSSTMISTTGFWHFWKSLP